MYSPEKKEKAIKSAIRFGVITVISLALTFPSMELIKNIPGNSFRTELEFIATALLVLVVWFALLTFCVWLVNYLIYSKKLKKNRFDKNIQLAVKGETKKFKTLAKILKWILIIACVYWIIMFVIMFIVFSGAAHK